MSLNFKFSNLIGAVYHGGNLTFSKDGSSLISPVSNRVTIFDLKSNLSETLAVESRFNITLIALNADGSALILLNERNEAFYVSLVSGTVIHRHRFVKPVKDIKFSSDGKHFAVCRDSDVHIFRAPGVKTEHYNSFFLEKIVHTSQDSTICLDWSFDCCLMVVGSRDTTSKVITMGRYKNAHICAVTGHASSVVGVHFMQSSYNMLTIDERGFLVDWRASLTSHQLIPYTDDDNYEADKDEEGAKPYHTKDMLTYFKTARHTFHETVGNCARVTCSDYHRKNKLLVCGFKCGAFTIHEMPHFNLIHNLSVSEQSVDSICVNSTGDWIGIGCGDGGQLIVWEWQSQSYAMKQHSHRQMLTCLAHSPDAHNIATGAEDGKVKVWVLRTAFCLVTFSEHTGAVTGVVWTQSGKALLSASIDGTVRAFDLKRYRNFRTLTTPDPAQLSCVCVDSSGDVVCSASKDQFDIFVWSLQTGRLLEVLSGHTAPVHSLHFNPVHTVLASVSWDKTLRTWDIFEGKGGSETMQLTADGQDVKFSPDGNLIATLTMDNQISLFEWREAVQVGTIEGRLDLDPGTSQNDQITASKSGAAKSFTCISFSVDGELLLVGGQSRFICLYSVAQFMIIKKWLVSVNYSLDAAAVDLDRYQMSEFGGIHLIDASDSEDEDSSKRVALPGSSHADASQRKFKPQLRVSDVSFSPTGRSWAACTCEGVLVYSLETVRIFDPYQLETNITPSSIRLQISKENYGKALIMALKLNEKKIIEEAIERTPKEQVDIICRTLPLFYAEKLLKWLADCFESTVHLQFYLLWSIRLLFHNAAQLKCRSVQNMGTLTAIQQVLSRKKDTIGNICNFNRYSLQYILAVKNQPMEEEEQSIG